MVEMMEKTHQREDADIRNDISPGVEQSVPGHVQAPEEAPELGEPGAAPEAAKITEEASSDVPPDELERLHGDLVAALKTVFDPEIPVDIYELGLIYRIDVDDERNIDIDMTLTAPGCPVAGDMPGWVQNAVAAVPGVGNVDVKLVFSPPWDMTRMSDEARLALDMF